MNWPHRRTTAPLIGARFPATEAEECLRPGGAVSFAVARATKAICSREQANRPIGAQCLRRLGAVGTPNPSLTSRLAQKTGDTSREPGLSPFSLYASYWPVALRLAHVRHTRTFIRLPILIARNLSPGEP